MNSLTKENKKINILSVIKQCIHGSIGFALLYVGIEYFGILGALISALYMIFAMYMYTEVKKEDAYTFMMFMILYVMAFSGSLDLIGV